MARALARLLLASLCGCAAGGVASALDQTAPTPAATIYPGEIIRDDMLRDASLPDSAPATAVLSRDRLVGKVARRTLMAGQPIAYAWVSDPQALANGALVQIVFEQGGISISAPGQAMHAGSVGEAVRVRNVDSGLVVTGTILRDGTVRVGG